MNDINLVEGEIAGPVWAISLELSTPGNKVNLLQLRTGNDEAFCPIFTKKHKAVEFTLALGKVQPALAMAIVWELKYFPSGGLAVVDLDAEFFLTHYGGDLKYIDN